ncbi:hypothetical protein CEXT_585381 [Caerostris extrusa]|uniref:Uncharacterized protein n=1 Tax=Caerostris extrusa TaxID=172846 RepID=A0AAV4Q970_CAEEX|nr:hypothetical protein CEXT_585381 [Caerostris extrusa]
MAAEDTIRGRMLDFKAKVSDLKTGKADKFVNSSVYSIPFYVTEMHQSISPVTNNSPFNDNPEESQVNGQPWAILMQSVT